MDIDLRHKYCCIALAMGGSAFHNSISAFRIVDCNASEEALQLEKYNTIDISAKQMLNYLNQGLDCYNLIVGDRVVKLVYGRIGLYPWVKPENTIVNGEDLQSNYGYNTVVGKVYSKEKDQTLYITADASGKVEILDDLDIQRMGYMGMVTFSNAKIVEVRAESQVIHGRYLSQLSGYKVYGVNSFEVAKLGLPTLPIDPKILVTHPKYTSIKPTSIKTTMKTDKPDREALYAEYNQRAEEYKAWLPNYIRRVQLLDKQDSLADLVQSSSKFKALVNAYYALPDSVIALYLSKDGRNGSLNLSIPDADTMSDIDAFKRFEKFQDEVLMLPKYSGYTTKDLWGSIDDLLDADHFSYGYYGDNSDGEGDEPRVTKAGAMYGIIPPCIELQDMFGDTWDLKIAPQIPPNTESLYYTFYDTRIEKAPELVEGIRSLKCTFMDCDKLVEIGEIPQGVIDTDGMCHGAISLERCGEIPDGVLTRFHVFYNCPKLKANG